MIKKLKYLFINNFRWRLFINLVISYVISYFLYTLMTLLCSYVQLPFFSVEVYYVIAFIISLGIFLFVFFDLMNITFKYINILSDSIHDVTLGHYDVEVPIKYDDELGLLAANINALAKTLNDREIERNVLKDNERIAYEAERLAEKQKHDLITNLAHDLRTPLTTIVGYIELIKDNKNLSKEEIEKYSTVAYEKSKKLQYMMDDLFEFTRLDKASVKMKMSTINICELILQIVDEFFPTFQEHHLIPMIELSSNTLLINGDGGLLARVFDNLLSNAIKYGNNHSIIKIIVTNDATTVTIKVINTGQTIPKEEIEQIFDKFYRSDSSRSSSTGGTGLGLAIAKNIVHMHNGKIYAHSEDDTTMFCVELNRFTSNE